METFDVIVLGCGGVGSSAAMHLARRGVRVLGLEQFEHGHDRGSSHGQTRAIRMAYFEHPSYVPLLRRAYQLWFQLEERTGEKLFHQVGLLEVGPDGGVVVPGVLDSAEQYQLPVEEFSPADVAERFPGFVMPEGARAVFEQNAGFLMVEQSVLAHVRQAERHGAQMHASERVVEWSATGEDGVVVRTENGEYHAGRLVITAGAWASQVLTSLGISLRVLRKHLHWRATHDDGYALEKGAPTFFFELPDKSFFYGFPQLDERGVKVAEHSGGEPVTDPASLDRSVDPADRERVETFLRDHLPGVVATKAAGHEVCMYTMTDDDHFIVDVHPAHPQVCLAAGLCGHGFKFTSVLGEALADLASEGRTDLPIEFLSCRRFAK